ncbi:MAG: hypothetical protein EA399_14680 [Desulfovibrionales bacterium]|nr:MAG: hypothetical protein EA399_14680 [Desulfovibrionales bacterium]
MQVVRLKRMRREELVFNGRRLASAGAPDGSGGNGAMHHSLELYQTTVGAFILAMVSRHVLGKEATVFNEALAFASLDDLLDFHLSDEGRMFQEQLGVLLKQVANDKKTFGAKGHSSVTPGRFLPGAKHAG